MASGAIFGLALIGAGLLMMTLATPLTNAAANTQAYFRPNLDKPAFKRRNLKVLRVIFGAWIVLGIVVALVAWISGP
ncbi:hypothetical protein VUN82_09360 [Micrococcaceae bacterium Sec5.1]